MKIRHCSKELFYRDPFGAVPCGTSVTLRCVFAEASAAPVLSVRYEAGTVHEHFSLDPASVTRTEDGMLAEYNLEGTRLQKYGVYFYSFSLCAEEAGGEHQITVYEKDLSVPEWFLDTVIYQIFPDRYYKAEDPNIQNKKNSFLYGCWDDLPIYLRKDDGTIERWEFYGGNLKGIAEKLPYVEALGCATIYLNPIFEAESNHRYDTADYKKIDGLLGGEEAFDLLLREAKSRGFGLCSTGFSIIPGKTANILKRGSRSIKTGIHSETTERMTAGGASGICPPSIKTVKAIWILLRTARIPSCAAGAERAFRAGGLTWRMSCLIR